MDPDNLLESMKKDWKNVEPILWIVFAAALAASGDGPPPKFGDRTKYIDNGATEIVDRFKKRFIKEKK